MGSVFEYVSIQKAAEALNVTPRSIYRYINRGHLRTYKEGQSLLVSRQDLQTLIEIGRDKRNFGLNKKSVAQLEAKVHVLEHEVDVIKRILDLRREPLSLDPDELEHLYRMAVHHITVSWSPHQEEMWSEVFVRLTLEDLEKLEEAVEDPHPWRPFFQLAKAIFDNPHDPDLKLQLNAGKNNVEKLAYIWAKKDEKDAKDLDRMIQRDDILTRRLMRKIACKRPKK